MNTPVSFELAKLLFGIMKTNKEYRFEDNPIEKTFHDKFKEMFERDNKVFELEEKLKNL